MTDKTWHKYPDEKPPHDGLYWVIIDVGSGAEEPTVFKYEDGDFNNGHYLELGNIVELWAEYEEDEECQSK